MKPPQLNKLFFLLFFFCSVALRAQVEGVVLSKSGNPIDKVHVVNISNNKGVVTDSLGRFNVAAKLSDILEFHHINYRIQYHTVASVSEQVIVLQPHDFSIEEVSVASYESSEYTQSNLSGINRVPSFLGESDILKYLSTLPGVTSLGMIDAGIYVRGGNSSQNAYLINCVTVADPQHIGGMLSVFDPYVLSNSKFYKSGYPSKYNGSLSSYIDMKPVNYSPEPFEGELNIGLLSSSVKSKFKPDKEQKSLAAVSFRKSYFQLLAEAYNKTSKEDIPAYAFNDLTLSYQFPVADNWNISLFGLYTKDELPISIGNSYEYDMNWNTITSVAELSGTINPRTQINASIGYNRSHSNVNIISEVNSVTESRTHQYSFHFCLNHQLSQNAQFVSGLNGNWKRYVYNQKTEKEDLQKLNNRLLSPFVDLLYQWSSGFQMKVGFSAPVSFSNGTNIYLSPRFKLTKNHPVFSWWIDYANTFQFEERMNALTIPSPVDVWVPVDKHDPSRSDHVSFGCAYNLNQHLKLKSALFYKRLRKIKDFNSFNRADINNSIDKMINGKGNAKGWEMDLIYKNKLFYGRINYTLSHLRNQFPEINEGRWFNPQYDVRHNAMINLSLQLNSKTKINTLWTYRSGITATVPVGVAVAKDINDNSLEYIPVYKDRYNYQLPSNHRLDANIEYTRKLKKNSLKFYVGAYNLYNQQNSNFVYIEPERKDDYFLRFKLKSRVIFPFMPYISLTYVFK